MEYETYTNNDELTHWGIKGMRWGIRRYQNKDGTLTKAGQKRYKAEMDKLKQEEQVLKNRKAAKAKLDRLEAKRKSIADQKKALDGDDKKDDEDAARKAAPAKKSVKDMSDAELNAAVNRARNEQAYAQLYGEQTVEKKSFAKSFLDDAVKPAAINAGRQFLQNAIAKAGERLLQDKVDPNSVEALKKTYEKLDYKTKIDKLLNPDKYLSEEDRNKRQQREFDLEERQAKREGYKDVADKGAKIREANENARKAQADETARKANESRSQEYYNSSYSRVYRSGSEAVNTGRRTISGLLSSGKNTSVSALPEPSVSAGKSAANKFILEDSSGNTIISWTGDDD